MEQVKKTAIEFLVDNLHYLHSTKWDDILEQSKAMEKQQIIESYKDSTCQFSVDSRIDCPKSAEQYYNEIYGK